ncbi:MAG TPA: hypothetical protein VFZ65_04565 [Planctomycetota bacterium]|nr:hypothetical protein [Planctomycetota bacterium]
MPHYLNEVCGNGGPKVGIVQQVACAHWIMLHDADGQASEPPKEARVRLLNAWLDERGLRDGEHQNESAADRSAVYASPRVSRFTEQAKPAVADATPDTFAKIMAAPIGILMVAIGFWLEAGGIWHAFSGHGVAAGLCAAGIPPFAWFMSIEFFFH